MKKLSYETLHEMNYDGYLLEDAPERVLQFGEGNFLRAFTDAFIDVMNEKAGFNSKVVICKPTASHSKVAAAINEQEGLYTLYLRGFQDGQKVNNKRILSCVSRCINPYDDFEALLACADNEALRFVVSNTTEAGIVYDASCQFTDAPASSYPGKLTQVLYRRFQKFGKESRKGLIILSCELIEDNGKALKKCVLNYAKQWELGEEFINWIEAENLFCSTLVDRIVTGYPSAEAETLTAENGYEDAILTTGEIFGFWVIEGPKTLEKEFPAKSAGLPVLVTDNHKPYKQRKVRILNGAHTSFVLGAYLAGQDIVRNCMEDEVICSFMNQTIYDEIIPTLDLSKEELEEYMKNLEIEGKGGTDFVPVFTYVQELLRRKEFSNLRGLLYFTDGKGRFPKKMPPYQTAFVLVQKEFEEVEVPPWAIRIYQTEEDGYGLGEKKDEH